MKFLFVLSILSCYDDPGKENVQWYDGVIVLANEEILQGEVFPTGNDLVLFRSNSKVKVVPAHQLQSVHFYDKESDINRKFISRNESRDSRRVFHLYEVVLSGEINLLRRKSAVQSNSKPHDKYDFVYFIESGEELVTLKKFRTTFFYAMMANHPDEMVSFIEQNRLNPNISADAVRIISYYNKLTNNQQIMTRHQF